MPSWVHLFCWLAVLLVIAACSGPRQAVSAPRPFSFQTDTFAYENELKWKYTFDEQGKTTIQRNEPKPDYSLRCFVMARTARQFFAHARFDSAQPAPDQATVAELIRKVVARSPRDISDKHERVLIPGYANLRDFSVTHAELLKKESGGAWQSYFQRGHWRMVFPISRSHQERTAKELVESLARNWPPVVHVVRFPSLAINHALLFFDWEQTDSGIDFFAYDPNSPDVPIVIHFDTESRTFLMPRNDYFVGGRVDVYEVFRGLAY